ncbi:FdhF/YdeP family oxidoreductase [Bosea sp. RCC_152_1]|uniref:FdhF/YdeP family oxidoreductase n=1 Tax=Bosea sp. RCC_152_1 TaxID=3239228 RepID=UPI0035262CE1
MRRIPKIKPYDGPSGGWGSVRALFEQSVAQAAVPDALAALPKQNKPDGFACVSCAWAKPAEPHVAEFCENGAKATFAELTRRRVNRDFFARHSVSELLTWEDHELEIQGRLTEPMRYDPASDRYLPVTWEAAFAAIGAELKALAPKSVVFYASGRASLEAAYLYQLFARVYGNNNLPDSSNMCHESTSVALPESIGVPVGTVHLEDFDKTDCILFFGQNVGSNSPRMLHHLQEASRRGVPIITFNPLRERGLERFLNPQSPLEMLSGAETRISSSYHQVLPGGDIAAIMGLCKAVLALDEAEARSTGKRVFDAGFIAEHTHGFDDFIAQLRSTAWPDIEVHSGLPQAELEAAASIYAQAKAAIGIYGMGLTQHKRGVETVQTLVNLLLLKGNIGKPGAGICPVRGHSNVQGQRTVGISEKPELVPLDTLATLFDFEPPREKGLNTVETCEGVLDGSVRGFIGLGGNFVRAVPEREAMEQAWRDLRLTVQIATKLNRSHLVNGEIAYLLPCLGRIEIDEQASGPQTVTIEDSTARIHASRALRKPAAKTLLSEPRIIAELAKATLAANPKLKWDAWVSDYGLIRDLIAQTYPTDFHDFNARMDEPGGFSRNLPAAKRVWKTQSGKANFKLPSALSAHFEGEPGGEVLRLITLRSNDQFNTTVYGYSDRFRGVEGTRMVVFMNRADMARLGIADGAQLVLSSAAGDGRERRISGFQAVAYDIPEGCCGGYYPECNALIPLWQHAQKSKVPAAKAVPVRIALAAVGPG